MMPTFLSNLAKTKNNHLIVESIKNRVSIRITPRRIAKHVAIKEFLGTLASCRHNNQNQCVCVFL